MPFPATRAFAIFRGEPRRDSRPRIAAATPAVGRSFGGADTGPLFVPGR